MYYVLMYIVLMCYCVLVQCGEVDGLVSSLREKVAGSSDVSRERAQAPVDAKVKSKCRQNCFVLFVLC